MIKIEVSKENGVSHECRGPRIELLAEIPMAVGPVMREIFKDCPAGLKDELIKTVFECILMEMQEVEA